MMRKYLGHAINNSELSHLFDDDQDTDISFTYTTSKNITHLHKCVLLTKKYPEINDYLEEYLRDCKIINNQSSEGWTALHFACINFNITSVRTIKLLLNAGANVNLQTNDFDTCLLFSLRNDCKEVFEVVQMLLNAGANPNLCNNELETPLQYSGDIEHNCEDITRILLDKGAIETINKQATHGSSALYWFLENKNETLQTGAIELLLKHGADPNLIDINEETSLHLVIAHKDVNNILIVIKMLIDAGANINAKNLLGYSPLHVCIKKGRKRDVLPIVKLLLELGADPNAEDENYKTPLHLIACFINVVNYEQIINVLLSHGANVLAKDSFGESVLHTIIFHYDHLQRKKNHYEKGEVPYKSKNCKELFNTFLEHGVDINTQNNYGLTVLHRATESTKYHFSVSVIKFLLEKKVDTNIKCNNGWTALDLLSHDHLTKAAKILINAGCVLGNNSNTSKEIWEYYFNHRFCSNLSEKKLCEAECLVCFETTQIYQCMYGHNFCEDCIKTIKTFTCNICNASL